MMALAPRLTRLDEQVLAALSPDVGVRVEYVAALVRAGRSYGQNITRDGKRRGLAPATPGQLREVREVLHGLQCVGLVVRGRGGWWRRS